MKRYVKSVTYSTKNPVKKSELSDYLPYISISETDAWNMYNSGRANILYKTKSGNLAVAKCNLKVDWKDWTLPTAKPDLKDGDTLKLYVHAEYTAIFVCTKTAGWGKVYYVPANTHYIPTEDAINYIADMYGIENFIYHKGSRYYKLDI